MEWSKSSTLALPSPASRRQRSLPAAAADDNKRPAVNEPPNEQLVPSNNCMPPAK